MVGLKLVECLQGAQPDLLPEGVLRLDLRVEKELELPLVWLLSSMLRIIWNLRQSNTRVRHYLVRSQLEAEINLLRETRYKNIVPTIVEIAGNLLR